MVLTPNPTAKMLVVSGAYIHLTGSLLICGLQDLNVGGKYNVEIKFGDGGGGDTPREPAYATHNPNFKCDFYFYFRGLENSILTFTI